MTSKKSQDLINDLSTDYSAVVGDAKVLAVIGASGELSRLFWPHIDFGQHIEEFRLGLRIQERSRRVLWMADRRWSHKQSYIEDSTALITESISKRDRTSVASTVFVPARLEAVVFRLAVSNLGKSPRRFSVVLYQRCRLDESIYDNTAFIDEPSTALVFYRRDIALLTAASQSPSTYHCGVHGERSSAFLFTKTASSPSNPIEHKSPDAMLSWDLGELKPGEPGRLDVYVVLAHSIRDGLARVGSLVAENADDLTISFLEQWKRWIKPGASAPRHGVRLQKRTVLRGRATAQLKKLPEIRRLYNRSLLTMKLLSDRETGAIIAAPEFDRERRVCGGYGYIWGRDGAFVAHAFGSAGHYDEAEAFFSFAAKVQQPEGVWYQRHYSTGEVAPSWGLIQIDETGAILWAAAEHYSLTQDRVFLRRFWPAVERAAQYLMGCVDAENGLPRASIDIWEEYTAQAAYSSAAVAGGLKSAAALAHALGKRTKAQKWSNAAGKIGSAIIASYWEPDKKSFIRAINKTVKAHRGGKQSEGIGRVSSQGRDQYIQLRDLTIDSSVLGLSFPFGVLDCSDPKMVGAVRAIRKTLWCKKTGGLLRYEGDRYIGGNPWILTTLWLALYYAQCGDMNRGIKLLEWTVNHATPLGLFSEQIDRRSGEPIWAVPLAWSHAMFALAAIKLDLV